MLRHPAAVLCVLSFVCLVGCSSNFSVTAPEQVAVTFAPPTTTSLLPGQTEQFTATVSHAENTTLIWEVNAIVGGNSQVGTISTTGLYTAPASVPATTTVVITAAAAANTSASATATITIVVAPVVTISPTQATVFPGNSKSFTASVANSTNTGVTWQVKGIPGGNAQVGTITSSGLYTAPASVATQQTFPVTAVASAFSGATASASVIVPPAPVITISASSSSVMATKTLQFSAAVSDSSPLTWQVNSIPGGNTSVGTISTTGLYTAPSAIPNPATVTIAAVSNEDPLVQVSQAVTITPLLQIVLTVSPSKNVQPLGDLNLTANSTIANDTLQWKITSPNSGNQPLGNITVTGANTAMYQAPATAPSAGYVTVYAYSTTYPTIYGSADITIGTQAPGVTVTPASANVALADTQPFTAAVSPSNLPQDVTWSVQGVVGGNASVGTVCNANSNPACGTPGVYTAPSILPTNQNPSAATNVVTITASSAVEPNPGTATVTVTLPNSVSVAINSTDPNPRTTLNQGESEHFSATVTPTNIPNVSWAMSTAAPGLTCGPNANLNPCGGITPDPNHAGTWNITYTAPTLPDALQSADIVLTATSTSDPAAHASITLTVTANPTITISPGNLNGAGQPETGVSVNLNGVQQFTAHPAHVPSGTQVFWSLGCINADGESPGASDECPGGVPWNPSGGDIDGDGNGPGVISPASGTNTLTVTYTGPTFIYFGISHPANVCQAANDLGDANTGSYAFVPLTAKTSGGLSATVCIQVNNHP